MKQLFLSLLTFSFSSLSVNAQPTVKEAPQGYATKTIGGYADFDFFHISDSIDNN
jgi:hypothetical protein